MPPLCHSVGKRFGFQGFRVMEDKMEAAILGCIYIYIYSVFFIGIMDKNMETTIWGLRTWVQG